MAFDIPMRAPVTHDTSVSQALYDDSTSRPQVIKVGSLEPTGPGGSTTTPPVESTTTPASTGGSNVLKQVIGGTTILPNTPGDGCTKSVGLVAGASWVNLGGVESHPDEKCNTARNEVVKQKTVCDFTVAAAQSAIRGLDSAGRQVDIARQTGSLPHLDIANQERGVASQLGASAAAAEQQCAGAAVQASGGAWGVADIRSPAPAPAPEVVHKAPHPVVHRTEIHHQVSHPKPKDTSCLPGQPSKKH